MIPRILSRLGVALFPVLTVLCVRAEVTPASLFCDHAVLQQGKSIPVWGTAAEGEKVTVEIAGQHASTTAAKNGRWQVSLKALPVGGPYSLVIAGKNRVVLNDILVGEVWVCGGQSNMERQLGLRSGQMPIKDWENEVATANFPQIRHFGVEQVLSLSPQSSVHGKWVVCSPETVADFTAVGFFFGRALYTARHVPIGLIHSSWGGTPAEAWMSPNALHHEPDFSKVVAEIEQTAIDPQGARKAFQAQLSAYYESHDAGANPQSPWSGVADPTGSWKIMTLPTFWENAGLPDFDGVVWFRKTIELGSEWENQPVELHLGAIDDADTTWVNGVEVGTMNNWKEARVYPLPAGTLKKGKNVIAVRVLDTGGNGGLWGGDDAMRLVRPGAPANTPAVSLAGPWLYQISIDFRRTPAPPQDVSHSPVAPSVLFNGMIAPLQPYAIRGVIWYQGEANADRTRQYRTLFPNLIRDWRQSWGQGDFPFLFVQIAPWKGMPPEIRESQLLTLEKTKKTAMAVTIDVGDANDIHPANKRPVGERLALAARAVAYDEKLEYSGPIFVSLKTENKKAVLHFTHLGGGLVAKEGPLVGFTIAGADHIFHSAEANIVGETVVVSSPDVVSPTAVRYGWANVPQGNLFNQVGLPASPFRTDVD